MNHSACVLATVLLLGSQAAAWPQDQAPAARPKLPAGVYAVQRDSLTEKEVLPLKEGEVLVVDRHRYLKADKKEPPRFLVVRSAPEVTLDLAGAPQAVKEGEKVVRISLKLKPPAATALERLTRDHLGKQITIILGGEVVTVHKIRDVIKGGDVQITSCAEGAAGFLLEQLKAHHNKK
jgi:preprotein translocase subunit SecD